MSTYLCVGGVPTQMTIPPKVLKRSVPGFEGAYSISTNGDVYSDERIVIKSNGQAMRVRERVLKETPIVSKGKSSNAVTYRFCVEGVKTSISKAALLKRTYPELFKPVDDLPGEVWKAIVDHPRYVVSNLGRVKRIAEERVFNNFFYIEQESLRHVGTLDHFLVVCLQSNDEQNTRIVARLVFESFHRPLLANEHVLYKDGDYTNVSADNLFAKTVSEYRQKCPLGRLQ